VFERIDPFGVIERVGEVETWLMNNWARSTRVLAGNVCTPRFCGLGASGLPATGAASYSGVRS